MYWVNKLMELSVDPDVTELLKVFCILCCRCSAVGKVWVIIENRRLAAETATQTTERVTVWEVWKRFSGLKVDY